MKITIFLRPTYADLTSDDRHAVAFVFYRSSVATAVRNLLWLHIQHEYFRWT